MSCKEEIYRIFKSQHHPEGADKLLDYLEHKSDFFTAPASARYHGAYEGGLCEHSLNVSTAWQTTSSGTGCRAVRPGIQPGEHAIVALCHDFCKIGCYKKSSAM